MDLLGTAYVPPHASTSLATARQGIVSPLAQQRSSTSAAPVPLQSAVAAPVGVSAGLGRPAISATGPDRLERPRDRSRQAEVSLSALTFLFGELISQFQSRVSGVAQLERRLSLVGYSIGQRLLLLATHRLEMATNPKMPRRETRLVPALLFVHTHVYRQAFGKPADSLERSTERDDEYMISTNDPVFSRRISVPKDLSSLSIEAITAGIVEAALDGLGFSARVTAHSVPTPEFPQRTTILIKVDPEVMRREEALGS